MANIKNIIGISGSLRINSINSGLLRKVNELLPEDMKMEVVEIGNVPLYNSDLEAKEQPAIIKEIKSKIETADGILIATPEYNYSVSGVLKNVIDWLSRPPDRTPLRKKPLGIIGASSGMSGTIRAQLHLRQIATTLEMYAMPKPEVLVSMSRDKFDANSNLTDEKTIEHLKKFIESFKNWIEIFNKTK